MRLAYYDDGAGVFNSAILTINLEHGGMPADLAWLTMYLTVLAGDTNTTTEEFDELMGVICPIFNEVFSGEKRVNGSEVATLRGVGYALEINEAERVMRLFTNVAITQNDPQ